MGEKQKEFMVMDESDAPFKEGEYELTLEDKLELLEIVKKYNLVLDTDSDLYKLGKELNIL